MKTPYRGIQPHSYLVDPLQPGNPLQPGGGNREGATRVPWTAGDVLAIIGLDVFAIVAIFMLLGFAFSLASTLIPGLDGETLDGSLLVTAAGFFLQWAVTLGVAFTYLSLRGYRLSLDILAFRRPVSWGEAAALVIGLLIAFYIFLGIYNVVLDQLFPRLLPEPQDVQGWYGFSILGFLVALVQVAIITPVVEEIFFRGIIHQGFEKRLGFIGGALLSSLVFGLAHVDYTLYFPTFVLGFIFAFLVHHTRSLWPAIAAHFLVNSLAVLSQFGQQLQGPS